jgi:apolipoprotein N-acyltransferase
MKIKWLHVVRDIVVVWGVTSIGGLLVWMAMANQGKEITLGAIWLTCLLANTVAFCFVGCLTPKQRCKHLVCVAIGVWLTYITINVYQQGAVPWGNARMAAVFVGMALGVVAMVFVPMVIGGVLSYLFVRTPKESSAEPTPEEPPDGKTDG